MQIDVRITTNMITTQIDVFAYLILVLSDKDMTGAQELVFKEHVFVELILITLTLVEDVLAT